MLKKEDSLSSFFKKPSFTISSGIRKRIWEMYMGGPGKKEDFCPLCLQQKIQNASQNSGFNACHMVADKFMLQEDLSKQSVYYLFPGCAVCNQECADLCILDYLYGRGRYTILRRVMWSIYSAYVQEYQAVLREEDRLCWKVIKNLYGSEKFPAGGGIHRDNEKAIYEMARNVHTERMLEEQQRLLLEMQTVQTQMTLNVNSDIKPMRLNYWEKPWRRRQFSRIIKSTYCFYSLNLITTIVTVAPKTPVNVEKNGK